MGRRKRSRQDETDVLESYEREWLVQRENASKQQDITQHDGGVKDSQGNQSVRKPNRKSTSLDHESSTTTSATAPALEQDRIERQRLKKQRQKERRKEKKIAVAASRESTTKYKVELDKNIQLEKKRQLENKQSKAKNAAQSFRTFNKGVKCLDLVVGKGPMVQHRKKVHVSYTLRAKSHTTGKILDSSKIFGFRVGKGEVIQGWDIGLEYMKVGGIRRLIVPPQAGYGSKDVGAGKGADLYFEIELLHVAP